MEEKDRITREKDIQKLNEKEFRLLLDFLGHYEKFKLLTWMLKWIILCLLAFTLGISQFIDAIDNCLAHIKRWLLKL
ncbi:putative membrane protein [Bartonella australis AUST/NH1]|uniref:Putative membrane protein n=1 Tax=Bartonella australis (strain Aust/NH1) TaxID=1094489 RepID=M1NTI0_BARAA|nr:putative membrane protein [Bartonella australis AUST/NH1]